MPGMKDEMTVWIAGEKIKLRKHYLTLFLREAHQIFCELHPDNKIGFSKFRELRPQNVLLMKETPADQCKCKTHENFYLLLKALKLSYEGFWEKYLCETELDSACWQSTCENCKEGAKLSILLNPEQIVKYRQWESKEHEVVDENKQTKKYTKMLCDLKEACAAELLDTLRLSWEGTLQHINVKRIQASEFESDKFKESTRVLQVDFAMNYSCEYQKRDPISSME